MPAVSPRRFSRTSSRLSLIISLSASPLLISASWADDVAKRSFEVSAGTLGTALTRFASQAGVNLSVDPAPGEWP